MSRHLHRVSHQILRYANCWEDADVLLQGLQPLPGSKILSIASAGDNSFSLLTTRPETVVAVDINHVQLNLTELKKAAFLTLDYLDFLEFLGFRSSEKRVFYFKKVKEKLSPKAAQYWQENFRKVERGIVHQGKFENYFYLFRKFLLPLIHSRNAVQQLFEPKSAQAQKKFYFKKWNNFRWQLVFHFFFSKKIMGRFGRDPQFFSNVKIPVSRYIFNKAEAHLQNTAAQTNPYLEYILMGNFSKHLPHYIREENFELIKQQCNKLQLLQGLTEDVSEQYKDFTYFNLSNIFEYMKDEVFIETTKNFAQNSQKGAVFAYWNLMTPRRLSMSCPESFAHEQQLSGQLTGQDKCFFYSQFIIDKRI